MLGVSAYLRPDLAARAFGIDPDQGAATPSAVRLFGAREAAMGAVLAFASGPELRRWLVVGAAVDSLDVLTVALGARRGRLGSVTVTVGTAVASLAVALGVRSLGGLSPPSAATSAPS